ncbi:MAG: hypothetical protein AAF799_03690 [Myxococcota bacterium]
MGHEKVAAAGGLVMVLGLFGRLGDDCLRAGARGARSLDDVAAVAPRTMSWGADDTVKMARSADGTVNPRAFSVPKGTPVRGSSGHWGELGFDALDITNVVELSLDTEPAPEDRAWRMRARPCVGAVLATDDPTQWSGVFEGRVEPCAPVVVVGALGRDSASLMLDGQPRSMVEMAERCAAGSRDCLFVACSTEDRACRREAARVVTQSPSQVLPRSYERELLQRIADQPHPPERIVAMESRGPRTRMVIAVPATRPSAPPR